MRILIFLYVVSSCLFYYGNAAGNMNQIKTIFADNPVPGDATVRNKRDVDGGETEQDPNDPKYQKMAEELVRDNLRIKKEDIRNIKVISVTTQVVSGTVTRMEIGITLVSGISDQCKFKIWEQPWENVKHVNYECLAWGEKKLLSANIGTPRPEQIRDPKDPKYHKLAETSIDYWFSKNPEAKPFGKEEVDTIYVTNVKAQIGNNIKNHIHFVVIVKNTKFECTSNITETPWNPKQLQSVSEVTCSLTGDQRPTQGLLSLKLKKNIPGGENNEKPWDPKYKKIANQAFQKYQTMNNLNYKIDSTMVDKVTSQVVAGIILRINFHVLTVNGPTYTCHSKVFEPPGGVNSDIKVYCSKSVPGYEEEQDPEDPQYKTLAEKSFKWYQNNHKKITVKGIDVDRVTTQIVDGIITRITFVVYPTKGNRYRCNSKIFEEPEQNGRKFQYDVNCTNAEPGGQVEQDAKDPKYQKLAEISFKWYQISHNNTNVRVKSIKVKRVTTQVVAGMITRISFDVNPTRGSQFKCFSKIFKGLGPHLSIVYDVSCSSKNGGEEEQDPSDSKYQDLAKESFQWYIKTHKNIKVRVKRIEVNRATTQVVAGLITRLDFLVYPTKGVQYKCQSEIFEEPGLREFDVHCNPISGGEEEQDPDDPKYHKLAKISFDKYEIEKKIHVTVKSITVKRVTTQVVAGTITRISFDVIPTRGSQFNCFSKILKGLGPLPNIDYDVSCNSKNGGEEEQDPSDPKYQDLAKESFQWYINMFKNVTVRAKRIKVNRVTTQVVAGLITRLNFRVYPTRGIQYTCQSKIFEEPGRRVFHVNCNSISGGEEEQDPDDPKYHKLAKISFDKYQTEKKTNFIVKSIKVNRVTTQVVAGLITRIHFGVHPTRGNQFTCFSKVFEGLGPHTKPDIDVVCNAIIGGEVEQDPDNPKYQDLAKESFKKYLDSHKNIKVRVKRIEVNQVTTQVVAGLITRIYFGVHPTRGRQLTCFSKIDEGLGPNPKSSFHVDCKFIIGGEEEQDPDDPKYQPLAKESFEWYQKLHPDINVQIKSIKVYDVTTQVVAGKLIRMNFRVHPTRGPMFMCKSKIWEQPANLQDKLFDVSCNLIPGGEVEEDPNDPQYMKLAQQSFIWYQKSHNVGYAKGIDIDSVTSQVVAGTIIRIYFRVLPSRGSRLNCFSKIFEPLGLHPKWDFNVSCANYNGGEEEQDPTKPQFLQLAKESFRVYREAHPNELIAIREMRVTQATTQIVAGVITRLHYYVISTKSAKYVCHSEIFDQAWEDHKIFTGDCNDRPITDGNKKLTLTSSSMSNTKDIVSNAIEEYLRNKDPSVQVERYDSRSLSVFRTRVAKQRIHNYHVDVSTYTMRGDYANYNCSVLTGAWYGKKPFSTNCIKVTRLEGRSEWVDPTNTQFYSFAEKALQQFLKKSSHVPGPRDYRKYDIIVTFVTRGLAAGDVDYINFFARWIHDRDDDPTVLLCNSKHWEKLDGKTEILKADCSYMSWNRNRS